MLLYVAKVRTRLCVKGVRFYLRASVFVGMTVFLLTAAGIGLCQAQGQQLTVEELQLFQEKLNLIIEYETIDAPESQRIILFEHELNGYLQSQVLRMMPAGVTTPHLSLKGEGQLLAEAVVDLDIVRNSQPRTFFDPFRYLRGSLLVAATGILRTSEGIGYLEITSIKVDGFSVPTVVLYELVRYYSRNETQSKGINLDEPFKLPYKVRKVLIEAGRIVVVQ